MSEKDLDFRATKDIDMVLIIEALSKEFAKVFGNMLMKLSMSIFIKAQVKLNFIVSINQNHLNIQ